MEKRAPELHEATVAKKRAKTVYDAAVRDAQAGGPPNVLMNAKLEFLRAQKRLADVHRDIDRA